MTERHDPVDRFLSGVTTPRPPEGLRALAVSRAEHAFAETASPDRWRLLWESRPLRLAWCGAVAALVVAHVAVSPSPATRPGPPAAVLEASNPELEEVVSLPRLAAEHVVFEATAARPAPTALEPREESRS